MKEDTDPENDKHQASQPLLVPGEDYYINETGHWVFTSAYHLKRGYCCQQGCKHCPYRNNDEQ